MRPRLMSSFASALRSLVPALLALPLVLAACDEHDEEAEPFDTLAACYEDHHGDEGLPVDRAIAVCCIDHPIAGVKPSCGATAAECATHIAAELDDVSAAEAQTACALYIEQKQAVGVGPG